MSPEENLVALGLRQLPPTPLCDEDVKVEDAAGVNGEPKPSGPRPAETSSEQAEPAVEPGRESLVKLAAGDIAPFFELAERDPGFPFEPDTIDALNRLARDRRADFERASKTVGLLVQDLIAFPKGKPHARQITS